MVRLPTPIQKLHHPILEESKIQLYVKRDDLVHPEIMGNKWRKLKYNLQEAKRLNKDTILTMGGAFSNHIYATAAAGKLLGFKTIGVIRGEELNTDSNETLRFAHSQGMQLQFIDRERFRKLREDPKELVDKHTSSYFLPEGGTNQLAIPGCAEILQEISIDFDMMVTPIGTGGTFCGLLKGVMAHQTVLGISTLKGDFIREEIRQLKKSLSITNENHEINTTYHFGGYGKTTKELIDFIDWFEEKFNVPLDPIYTGKSFFGVWNMIENNKLKKNIKIVLLHTGGLQGNLGFNRKKGDVMR